MEKEIDRERERDRERWQREGVATGTLCHQSHI
jgi:hypothetical protein